MKQDLEDSRSGTMKEFGSDKMILPPLPGPGPITPPDPWRDRNTVIKLLELVLDLLHETRPRPVFSKTEPFATDGGVDADDKLRSFKEATR